MVSPWVFSLALSMCAELTVLHDYGGVASGFNPTIQVPSRQEVVLPGRFPVETPELSPGRVEPHTLALSHEGLRIHPAVFVIGTDSLSIRWLRANHEYLQSINAHGMVVNVNSQTDFYQLKQIAGLIPLVAVPGGDLAKVVNTAHYPFLLHEGRVAQ